MIPIGQDLKRERELRGISLKEIAEFTKINIRLLRALEEDQLDVRLPGVQDSDHEEPVIIRRQVIEGVPLILLDEDVRKNLKKGLMIDGLETRVGLHPGDGHHVL